MQSLFCDLLNLPPSAWRKLRKVMRTTGALLVGDLPREFFLETGCPLDTVEFAVDSLESGAVRRWADAIGFSEHQNDNEDSRIILKNPNMSTVIIIVNLVMSHAPFQYVLCLPSSEHQFCYRFQAARLTFLSRTF